MVSLWMCPKKSDEWVSRGILSACECFSCENKLAHRFRETKISILCRDYCSYKPVKGAVRSTVEKLEDIEQIA